MAKFACEGCGQKYEKDENWSEEQALEEMRSQFGDVPEQDRAILCTSCYRRFLRRLEAHRASQN